MRTFTFKILILLLFAGIASSQDLFAKSLISKGDSLLKVYEFRSANKLYNNFAYTKAIAKYNLLLSNGFVCDSLLRNLAQAYFKIDSIQQSELLYMQLAKSPSARPTDFYYLAQTLKFQGKYKLADEWMTKFNLAMPSDSRGILQKNASAKIAELMAQKSYVVNSVPFNCKNSDFGAVLYGNEIIFSSARNNNLIIKRTYSWNEKPYLDIFAVKQSGDSASIPTTFSSKLNSIYHDGPLCFSSDEKEVFFTRNNFYAYQVPKSGKDGVNNLKILSAKKSIAGWSDVVELPFNSNSFSTGHPSVSPSGDTLFFASDRPGGTGRSDLYYVTKTSNGWSDPVNLGPQINTEGDEMFPFIDSRGALYFSSNGRLGLGGLDIFVAQKLLDGKFDVRNLGAPINSSSDDFSFYLNKSGAGGFIASNRTGGVGDDDIYAFTVLQKKEPQKVILKGAVFDVVTKQELIGSKIIVLNEKGEKINVVNTNSSNEFQFEVNPTEHLTFVSSNSSYIEKTDAVNISSLELVGGVVRFPISLQPVVKSTLPFWGLTGCVYLLPTKEIVPKVEISIVPKNGGAERVLFTDSLYGAFKVRLTKDTEYDVVLQKKGFFTKRLSYSTVGKDTGYVNLNQYVELSVKKAELGASIEVNVLYDLGKFNIRPDAAQELDDMAKFLQENPSISIELSSHTDSRGSDLSNLTLSQKRAESATSYIISKGISQLRIKSVGYGETHLINRCGNGVKCTEAEHQQNRRTEVKIIGI